MTQTNGNINVHRAGSNITYNHREQMLCRSGQISGTGEVHAQAVRILIYLVKRHVGKVVE